jgi:hypothetical protein
VVVIVIDFIQKQLDASERLFHVMVEDNKQRLQDMQMWVNMTESYQKKLAERDEEIIVLKAKLSQYEIKEKL